MRVADFDYGLPPELVAQRPAERREDARLLVHAVGADRTVHARVADLPEHLAPGDLLVLNDTRVLPARLYARRRSGGAVELLFLEPAAGGDEVGGSAAARRWRALANPARKLKEGEALLVEGGALEARLVARDEDAWLVELVDPLDPAATVEALLERHGRMPLPPYVERGDRARRRDRPDEDALDRERYQTVYAARPGAVAAPTAGLHLTEALLARCAARGIERATVTLHVGPGTFRPVQAERVEDHRMHAERYELPDETAAAVARARADGGRVVCVGTTSARVLEACARPDRTVGAGRGSTRIFLHPEAPPRVADALLTNFHLPRSTLLMLVAALAGTERVLRLYREAVAERYRFYSYGDAMLLLP